MATSRIEDTTGRRERAGSEATYLCAIIRPIDAYEELNDDHSKLDDIREWILGDQAADPRCAPDHRNTTLKVHVGPVSGHVANWGAVEETLRGTRYEHLLSE